MLQSRQVYPHESDQRPKRNYFRGELPRNGQHSYIGKSAHNPDVVDRVGLDRTEMSKNLSGQNVIPAHAVEKSRRPDMPCQPASDA